MPRKNLYVLALAAPLLAAACGNSDGSALRSQSNVTQDADADTDGSKPPGTRLPDGAPAPSAGGSNGSGGAAGAPSVVAGQTGAGGTRAAHTDAGVANGGRAATTDAAVDATPVPVEAGHGEHDGHGGCAVRSVWYGDADGDGYGSVATAIVACSKPAAKGWVSNADDCNDQDARVHPSQTSYFGTPYPGVGGVDSFDYDCSGDEQPDPLQQAAPTGCALLSVGTCGGAGYVATTRTGQGTSALCGSVKKTTCVVAAVVLCQPVTETVKEPFRCK